MAHERFAIFSLFLRYASVSGSYSVIPAFTVVIPAFTVVIPAQAGIQRLLRE